jgi:photosystem II stability/assembly factor-like uncharacterized protein
VRVAACGFLILLITAPFLACKEETEAWQALPLNTAADFRSVFFADAEHGWIAGGAYNIAGGLIGKTNDGGKTWEFSSGILSTHPRANGLKIEALHFFDKDNGVAAADGGKIYLTADGGENWGEVRRFTGPTDYLFDLHFLDESTGWAAGLAGLFRTTDGGETWSRLTDRGKRLEGRAVTFVDESNGWIVGQHGVVMTTTDGGRSWREVEIPLPAQERPDLWDVFFEGQRGWIAGAEGTLLHTRDGGRTWAARPLGIEGVRSAPKLERIQRGNRVDVIDAGDRTPGLTLAAIQFVDAQHGWIVGFFANIGRSLILRTVDGGATWTIDADIAGEELRALFAIDSEHAWAIGARTQPGEQAIYRRAPAPK